MPGYPRAFLFKTFINFLNPKKTLILKIPAFAQEIPALSYQNAAFGTMG
jgi:hypothetical protein